LNQDPEDKEEWIDTMTASKRFRVTTPTLYELAYSKRVETRTRPMGRLREKLEFKVSDLKAWDDSRDSHWKEKSKERSETPGQAGRVPALAS
jgi:hypothetical protein